MDKNLTTVGFGYDKKKIFCNFVDWVQSEKGINYFWCPVPMADCVVVYFSKDRKKEIGRYRTTYSMHAYYDTKFDVDEELWFEYVRTNNYKGLVEHKE